VPSDALVLCYHALSPTWTAALSITPDRLERHLALLSRRGYRGVTFTEAATSPTRGRVAAVTFDDAFASVFDLARPLLERFGMPATVFVPTGLVGSEQPVGWPGVERWLSGEDERELRLMGWGQLRSLADAGWEIGSHTVSHPRLPALDDDALKGELERSKATCERELERACTSLAYPYGDVDARVAAAAARAGYAAAAALPEGRLGPLDPIVWPRIGVYNRDATPRFALKISPAIRRLRSRAR
jgi:peptidoglycan/xylan/chitin deacetylase (PgdA/CDA1 family)